VSPFSPIFIILLTKDIVFQGKEEINNPENSGETQSEDQVIEWIFAHTEKSALLTVWLDYSGEQVFIIKWSIHTASPS
jgi:hypothetical protein